MVVELLLVVAGARPDGFVNRAVSATRSRATGPDRSRDRQKHWSECLIQYLRYQIRVVRAAFPHPHFSACRSRVTVVELLTLMVTVAPARTLFPAAGL